MKKNSERIYINGASLILIIGMIITRVVEHFYRPWGSESLIGNYFSSMGLKTGRIGTFIMNELFEFFSPALYSLSTQADSIYGFSKALQKIGKSYTLIIIIIIFTYCLCTAIVTFFIESYHSSIHAKEGIFTICINMICIESIVFYFMNVVLYSIASQLIAVIGDSESNILYIIIAGLFFVTIYLAIGYCCYLLLYCICALIALIPPLLMSFLTISIHPLLLILIVLVTIVYCIAVFAVGWRMISDKIFNKCYSYIIKKYK